MAKRMAWVLCRPRAKRKQLPLRNRLQPPCTCATKKPPTTQRQITAYNLPTTLRQFCRGVLFLPTAPQKLPTAPPTVSAFRGYLLGFPFFVRFRGIFCAVSVLACVRCGLAFRCRAPWGFCAVPAVAAVVAFYVVARPAVKIGFFWRVSAWLGYLFGERKNAVFMGVFVGGFGFAVFGWMRSGKRQ